MNISGRVLREVEFRDRLRGYDTDEVDEFLEKVAVAVDEAETEIADLKRQVEAAEERASEAASRAASRPTDDLPSLDDDGIRRTLVLAQRTADLAISEAREEAERLVDSARSQAEQLVSDADERARRLRDEAEQQFQERMGRTSEQHEELLREIGLLQQVLEGERERLTAALSAALHYVGNAFQVSEDVAESSWNPGRSGTGRAGGGSPERGAPLDREASSPGSGEGGEVLELPGGLDAPPDLEVVDAGGSEGDLEPGALEKGPGAMEVTDRDADVADPSDAGNRSAHPAARPVGRATLDTARADDIDLPRRPSGRAAPPRDAIRSFDWRADTDIDPDDIELQLEQDAAAAHVTPPWESHARVADRRPRLTIAGDEPDEELWARWAAGSEDDGGDVVPDADPGPAGSGQEPVPDSSGDAGRAADGREGGPRGTGGPRGGGGIFRMDRRRGGH